jgi:hypothetical protein
MWMRKKTIGKARRSLAMPKKGNDTIFCLIFNVQVSHLKKDPARSANASDGPCDKDEEDKPQERKDRILRHGDDDTGLWWTQEL